MGTLRKLLDKGKALLSRNKTPERDHVPEFVKRQRARAAKAGAKHKSGMAKQWALLRAQYIMRHGRNPPGYWREGTRRKLRGGY